jgi:hypothetical protein
MQVIKEQKAGIVGYIEGNPCKQYDDNITVQFTDSTERDKNKTVNYNGIIYYYGSSTQKKDGTCTATYWKNKPVW